MSYGALCINSFWLVEATWNLLSTKLLQFTTEDSNIATIEPKYGGSNLIIF